MLTPTPATSTTTHRRYSSAIKGSASAAAAAVGAPGGVVSVTSNWTYTAAACNTTVPHTQITCATVVGGGASLAWSLTVAGQASTYPTTGYVSPVISSITRIDGATPLYDASADGGDVALLLGAGFG